MAADPHWSQTNVWRPPVGHHASRSEDFLNNNVVRVLVGYNRIELGKISHPVDGFTSFSDHLTFQICCGLNWTPFSVMKILIAICNHSCDFFAYKIFVQSRPLPTQIRTQLLVILCLSTATHSFNCYLMHPISCTAE